MRDLMGRCWMAKTIIGIALLALLSPVAIVAEDLNTNLFKAITRGDTAIAKKLLAKGAYDSNHTCIKKIKVEMRIKKSWNDIRNGKINIVLLLKDLLLTPGRIILWIIYSIGCWLGI